MSQRPAIAVAGTRRSRQNKLCCELPVSVLRTEKYSVLVGLFPIIQSSFFINRRPAAPHSPPEHTASLSVVMPESFRKPANANDEGIWSRHRRSHIYTTVTALCGAARPERCPVTQSDNTLQFIG